ncbi:acyl dehydratase [Tersicoccus solisilvae]|uniref:Acyl dehydratase n=1 Tax=Tersicoccus solisilvae TaxID=1882339 RepID=A0ABQ1P096_9MICC|nr:MaoC/PaaZ C-terminal domain-containing protein [Tersicoccus solisilvae]GGC88177.1 acyl dehydratase [Tersicoccus solisilvae]
MAAGNHAQQRVVDLPAVPSLAGLYARQVPAALTGAVGAVLPRRSRPADGLPGIAYRATGIRPDPARLTAFAHLVRAPGSDDLPPGYVHALVFPVATALLARDDVPLPLAGLVHLQNAWHQRRPLTLASVLSVTTRVERLRAHRSGTLVDVVSEIADEADGGVAPPVAVDRSTYLARGLRLPAADGTQETTSSPRAPFEPPVPTGQWRLGADTGRRFAAVSGDWNPIHVSGPTARLLGMKGAIAHGMFTASRGLATVRLPAAFHWDVAFAAPVRLPATVAVRVDGVPADPDGARFTGWNPRSGALHLTSTVTAA